MAEKVKCSVVVSDLNKTPSQEWVKSSFSWHPSDILQVGMISADELHTLTGDPEDTVQSLPQASPSAWSTSSCGLRVSAPHKLNLIPKSFPLIPPEWTVNGTSIIYTDLSVRSCACCSGAALQQLRQRLDACLKHQNWKERTSFDKTGLIWDTWTQTRITGSERYVFNQPVFDESLPRRSLPQYKQIKLPEPRNTFRLADLGM